MPDSHMKRCYLILPVLALVSCSHTTTDDILSDQQSDKPVIKTSEVPNNDIAPNIFNLETASEGDQIGAFILQELPGTFVGEVILTGKYKWIPPGYASRWYLHITIDEPEELQKIPVLEDRADKENFVFILNMPHQDLEKLIPHESTGDIRLKTKLLNYLTRDIGASHSIVPEGIIEIIPDS